MKHVGEVLAVVKLPKGVLEAGASRAGACTRRAASCRRSLAAAKSVLRRVRAAWRGRSRARWSATVFERWPQARTGSNVSVADCIALPQLSMLAVLACSGRLRRHKRFDRRRLGGEHTCARGRTGHFCGRPARRGHGHLQTYSACSKRIEFGPRRKQTLGPARFGRRGRGSRGGALQKLYGNGRGDQALQTRRLTRHAVPEFGNNRHRESRRGEQWRICAEALRSRPPGRVRVSGCQHTRLAILFGSPASAINNAALVAPCSARTSKAAA